MTVKPITIEFKYPWTMMPLENAGEWIDMVKNALDPSDPLFGKEIFVSGLHEFKKLLLGDNDTDDNYAIVSIKKHSSSCVYSFSTVEVLSSKEEFARKIQRDHELAISQISKVG